MGHPTSTLRRLFRNVSAKGGSEVIVKLIKLAMAMVLTRELGAKEFGAYAYALVVTLILTQLTDMGLHIQLARELAKERAPAEPWRAALRAKIALGVLVLMVGGGIIVFGDVRGIVFGTMLVANLATSFVDLVSHGFRGRQDLRFESGFGLINTVVTATLAVAFAHSGHGAEGIAIAHGVGAFAAGSAAVSSCNRYLVPFASWWRTTEEDSSNVASTLRTALPMGIAMFVSVAYFRLDQTLLGWMGDERALAMFHVAFRLVEGALLLPAVVMAAVFPVMVATVPWADNPEAPDTTKPLLRLTLLTVAGVTFCGLAVAGPVTLFSDRILVFLFGTEFSAASEPLRALMPALACIYPNYVLTHFLVAIGREWHNTALAVLCFSVNLVANLWLIPAHGATGSAWSKSLSEAVLLLAIIPTAALLLTRNRNEP